MTLGAVRDMLLVVPFLRHHVPVVVTDRSNKQVIKANTGRVVTVVQDKESIRNGAVLQFPCRTVDQGLTCTPSTLTNYSVTVSIDEPCPDPTVFRSVDSGPEAIR